MTILDVILPWETLVALMLPCPWRLLTSNSYLLVVSQLSFLETPSASDPGPAGKHPLWVNQLIWRRVCSASTCHGVLATGLSLGTNLGCLSPTEQMAFHRSLGQRCHCHCHLHVSHLLTLLLLLQAWSQALLSNFQGRAECGLLQLFHFYL